MDSFELLPPLHDAVLDVVRLEWPQGRVRIELRAQPAGWPQPRRIVLTVENVRLLHCPRSQPWGASVSINAARLEAMANHACRITLEMQSGDALVVEGDAYSHFELDNPPPAEPPAGWSFTVEEVSAGVYRATGVDLEGRRIEATGTEPDELLRTGWRDAHRIVSTLSAQRPKD